MTAAADMQAIRDWLDVSSPSRVKSPLGDYSWPAAYAALLPIDPAAPAGPQHDLSALADGGLVLMCPQAQLSVPFAAHRLDRSADGLPSPAERVRHLFGHRLGVSLPDVLTVALTAPSASLMDVLTAEGLGDLDLAAVACLCVPLWAIPADQRATVAALCEHP